MAIVLKLPSSVDFDSLTTQLASLDAVVHQSSAEERLEQCRSEFIKNITNPKVAVRVLKQHLDSGFIRLEEAQKVLVSVEDALKDSLAERLVVSELRDHPAVSHIVVELNALRRDRTSTFMDDILRRVEARFVLIQQERASERRLTIRRALGIAGIGSAALIATLAAHHFCSKQ